MRTLLALVALWLCLAFYLALAVPAPIIAQELPPRPETATPAQTLPPRPETATPAQTLPPRPETATPAQTLPPRPEETPPAPTPTMTVVPQPEATPPVEEEQREEEQRRELPRGRIIGTVIDETSGAPAPAVVVYVGGVAVLTDSNGNYERGGLAPGWYSVWVAPPPRSTTRTYPPVLIEVGPDATVTLHLSYHSRFS